MLKIRLTRLGAKKAPFYRIVVADARAPREGRPVDTIGQYDATKQPAIVNVDEEKALAWSNCPSSWLREIIMRISSSEYTRSSSVKYFVL